MVSKSARFIPSIRLAQYDVVNTKEEDMGQVKTLIVDMQEGIIAFALVIFGGTMGFGDKWFAVPWTALKWRPETFNFILDMPEEVLKNAPGMDQETWLEEIDKWQEEKDLELLDAYYTSYGYQSYKGIVQQRLSVTGAHIPDAKFEIKEDMIGDFKFRLVATDGQVIAVSESYTTKENVLSGIASVKKNAAAAIIEDKTLLTPIH